MIPLRDDQPRFSTPYVTYFLIGLNSVIFLFESALTPDSFKTLLYQLGMVPANMTAFLSGAGRLLENSKPPVAKTVPDPCQLSRGCRKV